jgi:hypothetical protein
MQRLLRVVSLVLLASSALLRSGIGQATAAATAGPPMSRFDLYGGYAYYAPFASDIGNISYPSVPLGTDVSIAGYFTRHFGIQAEGNYSPKGPDDNNCVYTAQAGLIGRLPAGRFVPFAHVLGGGAVVGGPRNQSCGTWGWGGTVGGGLDIILPVFHDRIALRAFQADFMYAWIDNGPLTNGGENGGVGQVTAVRGSAGIVFRFGRMDSADRETPSFNCSAEPASAFPGDPVLLSASTFNVSSKQKLQYLWITSAGMAGGNGPTGAVDTANLQPGSYQVTGRLIEGDKQRVIASCSTSFTVRAFEPPTIACSADRTAIHSGDPVAIKASGRSPQNRPLSYSYGTTSGVITGNGPTAGLSTAGVSPGNITVTCSAVDDKGQTASNTASIMVAPPPPPPAPVLPAMQSLCGITFDRDRKRPDRVDNEAKGCLDDIALTLNRETADKLLIVGSHAESESNRESAIRAMNAADYLTHEKGIDPARLDLRIGPDNSRSVAMMLVPPGAVIEAGTATSFDTSSIKRTGQAYGTARTTTTPHRRKPKKATPQRPQ